MNNKLMSEGFHGILVLEYLDGKFWRVKNSDKEIFSFVFEDENIIPIDGFITDLTSIPRIFWSILPPSGKYAPAAVIHDFCYYNKKYSKRIADDIFYEAMKDLDVGWVKRNIMYRAVRIFGRIK